MGVGVARSKDGAPALADRVLRADQRSRAEGLHPRHKTQRLEWAESGMAGLE